MQVTVSKLSPVLVEFDVSISAEDVARELNKAYAQVARTAKISGFRPGKAPQKVVRHYFGPRVTADVAQRLVEDSYPKAIEENKLQPVSQPAIEPSKLLEDSAFTYKARVEVLPAIESVKYEGFEVKRPVVKVEDSAIDAEIQNLRKSRASVEPLKAARAAAAGDIVTIGVKILVDGEEVADAGVESLDVEVASANLIPAISDAINGKNAGDSAEASVEMEANHPHPQLKGKTAIFKIDVKEIKESVLPELDDEFAKDFGEFETLSQLTDKIKETLEKNAKESSDNTVAERLVAELVKANPIEVPPSLVQRQAQMSEQEAVFEARSRGAQADTSAAAREAIHKDAIVKVSAGLLMAEIAKAEGIQIGDKELEEGLVELAEQTGKNVAKLRVEYRDARKREFLVGMILENKVLDVIESKAQIVDES